MVGLGAKERKGGGRVAGELRSDVGGWERRFWEEGNGEVRAGAGQQRKRQRLDDWRRRCSDRGCCGTCCGLMWEGDDARWGEEGGVVGDDVGGAATRGVAASDCSNV